MSVFRRGAIPAGVGGCSIGHPVFDEQQGAKGLTPLPFKMVIPVGLVMALKPLGQRACKSEQMKWGDDRSGRPLLFDYAIYWGFLGGGCLII
ncbi:hypothetical protein EYF80_004947 [Liparis tanakae]|uniref:Uncharacterized protein n=1 Tax=Liparis tanakae TaxID=230148 RepID=A0A4Z2J5X9_9TELE|nr:hypothetical protein EYF80_004947 [Liparis tanakae]